MRTIVAALLLLAAPAYAQEVQQFAVNPADPNTPAGATGPAVQYTQRIMGTVISVGAPLYQNIPVGSVCQMVAHNEQHRPLNRGTVLGSAVGLAVGAALGDGSAIVTAATGAAGGAIGNRINRNNQQQQYVEECTMTFQQRIVGWTYTAQTFEGIQVQGVMSRQPRVGERTTIIVVQKFYAGE